MNTDQLSLEGSEMTTDTNALFAVIGPKLMLDTLRLRRKRVLRRALSYDRLLSAVKQIVQSKYDDYSSIALPCLVLKSP